MSAGPPRCLYAFKPQDRPGCQLTATVAYGATTLCSNCDRQRSTLGKGQVPRRLPEAADTDPLDLLDEAHAALSNTVEQMHAAVARARQHHITWTAIAAVLGTTRQAAQQRFKRP